MEKLINDGPMERELIADIALMEPGKDRGKKLLTYVSLNTPEEWQADDPSKEEPWNLMFAKVLTHIQQEVGFSDEQMTTLVSDYDEALGKWWEKQL